MLLPRTMLFLSRFKRERKGTAAIEFAVVSVPFFLLLFAIFDVSLMFFANTTLENGIIAAARQIRTGQAQAANMTEAQFRTMVCNEISMLLSCDAQLGLDVRRYNGFGNAQFAPGVDENGNLSGDMRFEPGGAGDVVVVRAFYAWPMTTPVAGDAFQNMANGRRLLEATIAFRNEPFNGPIQN